MVLEKRNRNDAEMLQSSTSVEVIKEVHVEMFKELVLDLLGTKFDWQYILWKKYISWHSLILNGLEHFQQSLTYFYFHPAIECYDT